MDEANVEARVIEIIRKVLAGSRSYPTSVETALYRAAYADGLERGAVEVEGLYLKPPRILDADTLETCIETIRQAARGESLNG